MQCMSPCCARVAASEYNYEDNIKIEKNKKIKIIMMIMIKKYNSNNYTDSNNNTDN